MSQDATASKADLELSLLPTANVDAPLAAARPVRESHPWRRSAVRTLFNYPVATTKTLRPTAWLDGLRGIAAVEVVLHHYHIHFIGHSIHHAYGSYPTSKQWWRLPLIRNYWHSAHAMVNVFFVISGFVLTQRPISLIRAKRYDKLYPSLSSAVFRRLVRIFAPPSIVTLFGVLLVRLNFKGSGYGIMPITACDTAFEQLIDWYRATEHFLNPFHAYENGFDILHTYEHVMWTLPLEYYGSLVCYITVLGVARVSDTFKRVLIILTIIYLALRRANWWSANFLVGTLLAEYVLSQQQSEPGLKDPGKSRILTVLWSLVFLWSFYVCGLPDPVDGEYPLPGYEIYVQNTPASFMGHEKGGRFWWMVAGITLTISISQLAYLRRFCETRFIQYLGKISFMLYLVHSYCHALFGTFLLSWLASLVASETSAEIRAAGNTYTASASGKFMVYVTWWIIMAPIVAIVSGLVTRHIDEPCIRFAKWLEEQFIDKDTANTG